MPLTLAGVPLLVPDPSSAADRHLLAVVQRSIDVGELRPFPRRAYPGPRLGKLAVPTGFDPAPPVRVNRLYWPWGASRWAQGFFLATTTMVEQVASAAFGDDGTRMNPVDLVAETPGLLSAEAYTAARMYCLTPVPLFRRNNGDGTFAKGLYLLPVVDQRFFWWEWPYPDFSDSTPAPDGVNVTWASLLDWPGGYYEIGIQIDDIDPAYRLPDPSLAAIAGEPLAPVLDLLCAHVGHRFVALGDQFYSTMTAQTAIDTRRQDDGDDSGHTKRTLHAGGTWFRDNL